MSSISLSSQLPQSPTIPGPRYRHYLGENDIPGMLAVHAGCREVDQIDPYSVCYRVPNKSAVDYAKDVALSEVDDSWRYVLIAEIEGRIVAHSRLEWWREWDAEKNAEKFAYLSRGWVLPEWRGKGIGTALLHWAESCARELDEKRGGTPGELAANASDGERDAIELLANEGYRLKFLSPELAYDDFENLPQVQLPEGFEIRPLESTHHRAVAHATIESNANADLTPEQLSAWIASEEDGDIAFTANCDPVISRIGWREGEVAGLHLCRRIGQIGDVANVAVRPPYRMQGLARALMFSCLHAMRDQGLKGARLYTGIGTDRDAPPSGPLKMYLGFGFKVIAYHNRYRKPLQSLNDLSKP